LESSSTKNTDAVRVRMATVAANILGRFWSIQILILALDH
jgi:hypothetical protein